MKDFEEDRSRLHEKVYKSFEENYSQSYTEKVDAEISKIFYTFSNSFSHLVTLEDFGDLCRFLIEKSENENYIKFTTKIDFDFYAIIRKFLEEKESEDNFYKYLLF